MQPGTLMQENKVIQSTISAYMWEFFRFILKLPSETRNLGRKNRMLSQARLYHAFSYYSFKT